MKGILKAHRPRRDTYRDWRSEVSDGGIDVARTNSLVKYRNDAHYVKDINSMLGLIASNELSNATGALHTGIVKITRRPANEV
jgi:hypothetical protein